MTDKEIWLAAYCAYISGAGAFVPNRNYGDDVRRWAAECGDMALEDFHQHFPESSNPYRKNAKP